MAEAISIVLAGDYGVARRALLDEEQGFEADAAVRRRKLTCNRRWGRS